MDDGGDERAKISLDTCRCYLKKKKKHYLIDTTLSAMASSKYTQQERKLPKVCTVCFSEARNFRNENTKSTCFTRNENMRNNKPCHPFRPRQNIRQNTVLCLFQMILSKN